MGMEGLENLKLNLGLGNILLATATAGNLLSLRNLVADGLGAEVLEGVCLGGVDAQGRVGLNSGESTRKEEGLGAAVLLNDLDDTRLELLNGGDVVGEDTHVARFGGDVDLDDVLRLEDGLVRQRQAQLDLVGNGLGVASALGGHAHGNGASANGRAGDTERVHGELAGQLGSRE